MNAKTATPDERCRFDIHIPRSLIRRIRARAAMEDRDVSDIVAAAIKTYLESHEIEEGRGNEILT
jgi:metal-responsive CopG/Arc/MetJ family transcriptional regulator